MALKLAKNALIDLVASVREWCGVSVLKERKKKCGLW